MATNGGSGRVTDQFADATESVPAARWWIVFASMIGLTVGTSSALINSFAVFVKPVTHDLHWSRGAFSLALLVMGGVTLIASPLFGMLFDRYRIRRVSLPVIAVLSAAIAAMSLMGPSLAALYCLYAVCSFVGPAQSPLMYSKAISLWFDRDLGIALGIATAGLGLGTMIIPLEGQYLISHFGWRSAYVGLGATNFLVAFPVVAIFIREPPGYQPDQSRAVGTEPGVTVATALRSWRFWALTMVFTIGGAANGSLVHVVALLTDRGFKPSAAAEILASSGGAVILGRLLGGYLLDRSPSPVLPGLLLLLPALGNALLGLGFGGAVPVIAVWLCGVGFGVEIDMMGFFVSRYFGRRAFARIYGSMWPGFTIGVGVGPVLMGHVFDVTHSYDEALFGNAVAMVVATLLLAGLGAYAFPTLRRRALAATGDLRR